MRALVTSVALAMLAPFAADPSRAADGMSTDLRPFDATIRAFDPTEGVGSGQDGVLPVDGPDGERAIASTTANAASFTTKMGGGKPLPVAFTCVRVEPRP